MALVRPRLRPRLRKPTMYDSLPPAPKSEALPSALPSASPPTPSSSARSASSSSSSIAPSSPDTKDNFSLFPEAEAAKPTPKPLDGFSLFPSVSSKSEGKNRDIKEQERKEQATLPTKGKKRPRPQDSTQEEEQEEDGVKLPRWATDPVLTLSLVETKKGAFLSEIPVGLKKRYLFGREKGAVDILLHHPTISRKHAMIIHGTPPGTPDAYADSATLIDLKSAVGTFYKKSVGSTKVHRVKPGGGVVLRNGMVINFGKSTRSYTVQGLDDCAIGSRIAPATDEPDSGLGGNASGIKNPFRGGIDVNEEINKVTVDAQVAPLPEEAQKFIAQQGNNIFSGHAGRHADYQHRKKARVAAGLRLARRLGVDQDQANGHL